MITVDGERVGIGSFPDGTILMKQPGVLSRKVRIEWKYEDDREFLALIYLVKHLRRIGVRFGGYKFELFMPYIPNARMDRVRNEEDVFTLKYFAELLNTLEFDKVIVLDPHSYVSEALINNIEVVRPNANVLMSLFRMEDTGRGRTIFYPDEGACKRYSSMGGLHEIPYAFGIKRRNWETGEIKGLDVAGAIDEIAGKDILIVDDICSRGGTFYHSAKKLKELGAKDIYLYVSHCENTILEGELLDGDLIKKVYTTSSIFTKSHEKVEVLK